MDSKKVQKSSKNNCCDFCYYNTCNIFYYNSHLFTCKYEMIVK